MMKKIVYMGTPEFAVPALEMLNDLKVSGEKKIEIGYVVTQPDRQKNRGKKVQPTPVKEKALSLGIEVLQPLKIKENKEILKILKEYEPDLIVVAAYGMILPKEILEIPSCGCVNIHGSLLPRWRGAAPIQRAIMAGDKITGITLMYMAEGLDTGDMIAKTEVKIGNKTSGKLYDELSVLGGKLLIEKLDSILDKSALREKQEESLVTYADMIFKKEAEIDFSKEPEEIYNMVRGLNPNPGSYTFYDGEMFKIWCCEASVETSSKENGCVIGVDKAGIKVVAGGKILTLKEVQVAGKKAMKVEDFIRGNSIKIGTVLG